VALATTSGAKKASRLGHNSTITAATPAATALRMKLRPTSSMSRYEST